MPVVNVDDGLDAAVGEADGGVRVVDGEEGVDGGGAEEGQVSSRPHEGSSHVAIVESWSAGQCVLSG